MSCRGIILTAIVILAMAGLDYSLWQAGYGWYGIGFYDFTIALLSLVILFLVKIQQAMKEGVKGEDGYGF